MKFLSNLISGVVDDRSGLQFCEKLQRKVPCKEGHFTDSNPLLSKRMKAGAVVIPNSSNT